MQHRVNGCLFVLTFVYEYAKILNELVKNENERPLIKMNETDICVNRTFARNRF